MGEKKRNTHTHGEKDQSISRSFSWRLIIDWKLIISQVIHPFERILQCKSEIFSHFELTRAIGTCSSAPNKLSRKIYIYKAANFDWHHNSISIWKITFIAINPTQNARTVQPFDNLLKWFGSWLEPPNGCHSHTVWIIFPPILLLSIILSNHIECVRRKETIRL